jgi:hypothetical protein
MYENAIFEIQIEIADGHSGATITLTIRDDDIAELQEVTYIQLTQIVDTGTVLPGRGAQIGRILFCYFSKVVHVKT